MTRKSRGGPLRITASSAYAIHGLAYLGLKEPGAVTFLSEISRFFEIPASYLAKVFQALARAGLVRSYRGAKGGYALLREPGEITLREVIEVFEGPVRESCTLLRSPCRIEAVCGVGRRLARAQKAFLAELSGHTIAGISEEFRRLPGLGSGSAGTPRKKPG